MQGLIPQPPIIPFSSFSFWRQTEQKGMYFLYACSSLKLLLWQQNSSCFKGGLIQRNFLLCCGSVDSPPWKIPPFQGNCSVFASPGLLERSISAPPDLSSSPDPSPAALPAHQLWRDSAEKNPLRSSACCRCSAAHSMWVQPPPQDRFL